MCRATSTLIFFTIYNYSFSTTLSSPRKDAFTVLYCKLSFYDRNRTWDKHYFYVDISLLFPALSRSSVLSEMHQKYVKIYSFLLFKIVLCVSWYPTRFSLRQPTTSSMSTYKVKCNFICRNIYTFIHIYIRKKLMTLSGLEPQISWFPCRRAKHYTIQALSSLELLSCMDFHIPAD